MGLRRYRRAVQTDIQVRHLQVLHEQMEQVREGAVTEQVSVEEQLQKAMSTIDDQRNYIQQLELSLQTNA